MTGIVLLALAGVGFWRLSSWTPHCVGPDAALPITVDLVMPEPVMNTDLTMRQITRKGRSLHDRTAFRGVGLAMGLTEANWGTHFNVAMQERRWPMGDQMCLTATGVTLRLELAQTIYLGRDVIRTECQIKQLMDHEMRHAEINRDMAQKHIGGFEGRVRAALAAYGRQVGWGPFSQKEAKTRSDALMKAVDGAIQAGIADKQAEATSLHAQIDTPQEYRRVSMACEW